MKCYVYCADVYCEKCGEALWRHLPTPENPLDESSYDSDDYLKGPYDAEAADYPQHCGAGSDCLDPTIINGIVYGRFLENPLTEEGKRYVKEANEFRSTDLTMMWMKFYNL
jgi:hypothetical protein